MSARWSEGVIHFASKDAFREQERLVTQGAMRIQGEHPPLLEEVEFRLRIGNETAPLILRGKVVAQTASGYLMQISSFDEVVRFGLARLLGDDRPSAAGFRCAQGTLSSKPIEQTMVKRTGQLTNPTTAHELRTVQLRVGMGGEPSTLASLLLHLGNRRATGRLMLIADGIEIALAVLDGRFRVANAERTRVASMFSQPTVKYRLDNQTSPNAPSKRFELSAWALVDQSLRQHIRGLRRNDIEAALPLDKAVEINRGYLEKSRGLCLSAAEKRFIERHLQSGESIRTLVDAAGQNSRATLDLILYLDVLGLVAYAACEYGPESVLKEDTLVQAYQAMQHIDFYKVLGLHWGASPAALARAIAALRDKYGPGSKARARNAELAENCLALVEEAALELSTPHKRRLYRRDVLHRDLVLSAESIFSQAGAAVLRGECQRAIDFLEAALDLDPRKEWFEELKIWKRRWGAPLA